MSLKAKIEAVIYAAEEPVTLAQLAGLFAEEALEEKRAREAGTKLIAPEHETAVVISMEMPAAETPENAAERAFPLTVEEAAVMAEHEAAAPEGQTVTAESSASPEDEKRATRQRDREIREELSHILNELIAEYSDGDRGMEIREIAGGYRVATKPEYHDAVRGFVKSLKPPMKLSLQALETLAVIAYKQPVTAPEVGEIRGVDSAGVIGSLISRKLVTTAGRKQVIGRPILYKTTKEFLLRFGLKDLNELPSMEEFEKMAAGELAEPGELPFDEQMTSTPNSEGIVEVEEEVSEGRAEAKALAAVEMTDETAEEAEDVAGVEVEVEILTEGSVEAAAEETSHE